MDPVTLFLSRAGRIGPRAFWIAVLIVYTASFISQSLLDLAVIARAGFWPFTFAQAILIWSWYVLHAKRLRDGGVGTGGAAGAAVLFWLAVLVLVLMVLAFVGLGPDAPEATRNDPVSGRLIGVFFLIYLIGALTGSIDFGAVWWLLAMLVLIAMLPILVGLVVTLYAGTRPSKA